MKFRNAFVNSFAKAWRKPSLRRGSRYKLQMNMGTGVSAMSLDEKDVYSTTKDGQYVKRIKLEDRGTYLQIPTQLNPEDDDVVSILMISDTHSRVNNMPTFLKTKRVFLRFPPEILETLKNEITEPETSELWRALKAYVFRSWRITVDGWWGGGLQFKSELSLDADAIEQLNLAIKKSAFNIADMSEIKCLTKKTVSASELVLGPTLTSDPLPPADILIHAGDFTNTGEYREVKRFLAHMTDIRKNYKHMVVIAGNHDTTFEPEYYKKTGAKRFHYRDKMDTASCRKLLIDTDVLTYLEDNHLDIEGLRIYGSPWQPFFCDRAFNLPRGKALTDKWAMIPGDSDIVVTHGPPKYHGDKVNGIGMGNPDDGYVGCENLRERLCKIQPQLHIFGHIHEGYGVTQEDRMGQTYCVNASTCTFQYAPTNKPILAYVRKTKKLVSRLGQG